MTEETQIPAYDFENDNSISDKRKEACRLTYLEMELKHIDKIFTSAYKYDKTTGEPAFKKPKSVHELIFFLLQSSKALTEEINDLKVRIEALGG